MEIFQIVISLSHRVLICRSQAGACKGRLDPAGGRGHGEIRTLGKQINLPPGTTDEGMHVLRAKLGKTSLGHMAT